LARQFSADESFGSFAQGFVCRLKRCDWLIWGATAGGAGRNDKSADFRRLAL